MTASREVLACVIAAWSHAAAQAPACGGSRLRWIESARVVDATAMRRPIDFQSD
jgi:hypothetical protein